MKSVKLFLASLLMLLIVNTSFAQDIRVSGTVKDATTGEPVAFAFVLVKGTTTGYSTGQMGEFTINAPANGTLVISLVGYQETEVPIDGKSTMDILINPDVENLDDVIIVAYGTAKKGSFTGSAATVKKDDIVKRGVTNVTKALDGLAPGVMTTSGGGQPGSSASIQIRGYGSINASQTPLYVVDGVPFDGAISSINPADIESMSVLKDASAGALYGARGANGVIMITTKRGSSDRTSVTYRGTVGVSSRSIAEYDLVSQDEFVELTWEALKNGYQYRSGMSEAQAKALASANMSKNLGGEIYNPYKNYTWETLIDPETGKLKTDAKSAWNESWMDEITDNAAIRTEHQFSISGGNAKTKYMASFGYLYEDGVLKTTHFDRYSGRVNVDHQAKYWLKAGLNANLSYTESNSQQLGEGTYTSNAWYTAQFMAPIYPMYLKDAEGKDILDENGNRQYDYGEEYGRPKAEKFNTLGNLNDNKYEDKRDNVSFRANIDFGGDDEKMGVLKGLKLSLNMGGDMVSQNIMNYYNMYHGDGAASKGDITKYNVRTFSYTINQLLTYNRKFGKHSIDFLAGHEFYAYKYNYLMANKTGLVDGIFDLAPGTTLAGGNSYTDNYRVESFLGRINYNFADKYYISASYRTDGSSRFHKDFRWGDFWSVGASWRLSEESFMQNTKDWLSNLSVKVSYGSQGNDDLRTYYAWQSFYDVTYPNANNSGAIVTSLENKEVTWEKKATLNTGIEASLFNSRLSIAAEYYHTKTTDLLLSYPMAMSTGFTGYNDNVGSMQNQGVEFMVRGTIFNNPNFMWDMSVMGSFNKNKVTALTAESDEITGTYLIKVGMPIYTYYMAKSAGVDPVTGKQLYYAYEKMEDDGSVVGEYITSDYSKASSSRYYHGSRAPKLSGSIGANFRIFKDIDLSILTTYSIGGKILESSYASSMNATYVGDTWNRAVLRRWQKPGDVTDVPMIEIGGSYTTTDRFLIDASYFAIKNITLGYSLPKRVAEKINASNLRIFVNLDNLALFNHLDGMDPQQTFVGDTDYTYAPIKTTSFGIELNF